MALYGCGGGDDSPTSPSPSASPSPGGSGSTVTVTISSSGVSPSSLDVTPGTRVLFINNDSRAHDMSSDPHPIHTDCPEINQVGFLTAGQRRETGNLNTVRTCGYHDHNDSDNRALQGRIIIR